MSKYVSPGKRDNKKADVVLKPTDFPALSTGAPKAVILPKKSFALLASDWQERAEEDKMAEEYRKATNRRENERIEMDRRMMIVHHRMEEQIHEKYEEDTPFIQKDEWTTVDRKKTMVELTAEDRAIREQAMEENKKKAQDESVWNGNDNEGWDYRDRRVYS